MNPDTKNIILEILAEQSLMEKDDITLDSTPEDLGLDSINLVEVIFSLEETFDISIPFNSNEPASPNFSIDNVRSLIKSVEVLISKK